MRAQITSFLFFASPACPVLCEGVLLSLGAQLYSVQLAASHPEPGSYEAHPAGQMLGDGLRARAP